MADKRNQEMMKTLQQQKGVTQKNLQVITAPRKDLVNYKGKPAYKVQLDLQQQGATSRNIIYKKGSLEGAFLIFTTLGRT